MKIDLDEADVQYIIDLLFFDVERWEKMAKSYSNDLVELNLYVPPDTPSGWAEHFEKVAKNIMEQTGL